MKPQDEPSACSQKLPPPLQKACSHHRNILKFHHAAMGSILDVGYHTLHQARKPAGGLDTSRRTSTCMTYSRVPQLPCRWLVLQQKGQTASGCWQMWNTGSACYHENTGDGSWIEQKGIQRTYGPYSCKYGLTLLMPRQKQLVGLSEVSTNRRDAFLPLLPSLPA